MPCNPLENTIPFRLSAFDSISPDAYGLYSFWFKKTCIYVGKAEFQPIKKRLTDHWARTHNDYLGIWICAKGPELKIRTKIIKVQKEIEIFERFFIRKFKPLANKTLI